MIELLIMGAAAGGIGAGYASVRRFVRDRLRFVDAVQHPVAPVVAGAVGAVVIAPVAWVVPVIGGGTALLFGAGLGLGVRHGARDIRRTDRTLPLFP